MKTVKRGGRKPPSPRKGKTIKDQPAERPAVEAQPITPAPVVAPVKTGPKPPDLVSFVAKAYPVPKPKKKKGEDQVEVVSPPVFTCDRPIPSDTTCVPTRSPLLNLFLSEKPDGGIPVGRVIEIVGMSDNGKTSLLTEAMTAFQLAGGIVLFHDSDFKFNRERAVSRGWNPEGVIYLPDKAIESLLDRLEELIFKLRGAKTSKDAPDKQYTEPPILFAWDSAPSTPMKGNMPGASVKDGRGGMAEAARVLWDKLSRRLIGFLSDNRVTVIATSPLISQIGGFGGKTTALGQSIKVQATIRLKVWKTALKFSEAGPIEGIELHLDALKHHFRRRGGRSIVSHFLFDRGLCPEMDVYQYLLDQRVVNDAGVPWANKSVAYYGIFGHDKSFYRADIAERVAAHPDLYAEMVKDMANHFLSVKAASEAADNID